MTPEERIQVHAQIMAPVEAWLESWGALIQEDLLTESVISPLLGIIFGAVVSWAISRHFYKKGSKDMQSFSESFYTLEPGSNSDGYHLSERSILHCFGDFEMKNAMQEYKVYFPRPYALKPRVEMSGDFSRIKSKHVSKSGFIIQVDPAPVDQTLRFSYQSSGFPEGFIPSKNPKAL